MTYHSSQIFWEQNCNITNIQRYVFYNRLSRNYTSTVARPYRENLSNK
jgi:hypothetical protein